MDILDFLVDMVFYLTPTLIYMLLRAIHDDFPNKKSISRYFSIIITLIALRNLLFLQENITKIAILYITTSISFTIIGTLKIRTISTDLSFKDIIGLTIRHLRIIKFNKIMDIVMIQLSSLGISICKHIYRIYGTITMNNLALVFDKGSSDKNFNFGQFKPIVYDFIVSSGIQCFIITSIVCYLMYKNFPLEVKFIELRPIFRFHLKMQYIKYIYVLTFLFMAFSIYKPTEISESNFMELNYVNPKDLVTFPGEKRNIIFLSLESIESTFASKQSGGLFEESLIPNLERLTKDKENIHFTHKKGIIGGPKQMVRLSYTSGASYSMLCGDYLGTPGYMSSEYNERLYHPQITCLSDITKKFGYNNYAIYGTQWSSCRQGYLYTSHSIPIENIVDSWEINRSYGWISDFLMFDKAKQKILEISKEKKPFMVIMMTMDTHMPGFRCHLCNETQDKQYDSISCSDRQVFDFINWLKKQDFYENTTLILHGDHQLLHVKTKYLAESKKFDRRIYNLIINSKLKPKNGNVREYTLFDLFPTVLALAGAKIKGEKLGLGTNLFSNATNLYDKYKFKYLDKETMMENEWFHREVLHEPLQNHINFDFSIKFLEEPSKMNPNGDVMYF